MRVPSATDLVAPTPEQLEGAPNAAAERLRTTRLVSLFLAGLVIFGYPFLGLFTGTATLGGIPLLYIYLFVTWGLYIALIGWLVERD